MEPALRIPEKLFFRIGEVCDLIKVQPHVLRYWETEFPMLAPQKNRAGQRVYRRKDVEMVLRIRNLLYEEKFTIAGAKKRLQDEMHRSGPRTRVEPRDVAAPPAELVPDEAYTDEVEIVQPVDRPQPSPIALSPEPPVASPEPVTPTAQSLTPQARLALRVIRRDLEDLLTMLNSDASISG
jgi:DNA-binding transcriptional MerR regulator